MEQERYRDKYWIHGSVIALADGSGFSVKACVNYPKGGEEIDWHYKLPETNFRYLEEVEGGRRKICQGTRRSPRKVSDGSAAWDRRHATQRNIRLRVGIAGER